MKLLLSSMILIFSFIMLFLNNPLSMGLIILIQTMMTCLLTGMLIKTYWFSYILFLIFIGGLLVLFIYMTSIMSNELFKLSINIKLISIIILSMIIWMFFKNNLLNKNLYFNSDMNNFNMMMNLFFNNNNNINLNKLYNSQTFILMLMLMTYLFITLITVVKITNIFFGPLRTTF